MELDLLSHSNRNDFIEENKNFIYSTAYKICKRKLDWNNDDELSISLIAFNNACNTYDQGKGNFYSYAKVLVRNALIDYFRKRKNTPFLVFDNDDEKIEYIDTLNSLNEFEKNLENQRRAEEIAAFSQELSLYKLDFSALVEASPSHRDTRNILLNLVLKCVNEPSIVNYIKEKRLLPVKDITLYAEVNRKLVEKWRRYILALILALASDEYPYIKSYLNIKVGDINE